VPRNLTAMMKAAALAMNSDVSFWALVAISHPSFPETYRFVSNSQPVVRLGETWNPYFFEVNLPDESAEELSRTMLVIDNIDRSLLDTVLPLETPITVELYVTSDADESVVGPYEFKWRETQYDSKTILASLEFEDLLNQNEVKDEFNPSKFPALF